MCVGCLIFNVLLRIKTEQKIMLIFKNPLKVGFSLKYTFTIFVGRVWVVMGNFLFEKLAFNGLLKVISIQRLFQKYEMIKLKKILPEIYVKKVLILVNMFFMIAFMLKKNYELKKCSHKNLFQKEVEKNDWCQNRYTT